MGEIFNLEYKLCPDGFLNEEYKFPAWIFKSKDPIKESIVYIWNKMILSGKRKGYLVKLEKGKLYEIL